ncbi:UNVERIFIED_CONTAM: hypothetical protein HDU68_009072 [Siphonaria sp. JEL0065]|nr:hypothetical protein HDU68_009072 [Siphonaria sp. JEL0065]
MQQCPTDMTGEDGMSLALLLDRRLSVPNTRSFNTQYRMGSVTNNVPMDVNGISRRMSVQIPQQSDSNLPTPSMSSNFSFTEPERMFTPYSFAYGDMLSLQKYPQTEVGSMNSQMNPLTGLNQHNTEYMFPPQNQLSDSKGQQFDQNNHVLLQQHINLYNTFQANFSPLLTPQPNYVHTASSMNSLDSKFEMTQTAPSTPVLTHSPPTLKHASTKTALVPAKKLFRTTPEPGLDLLLNSPVISPANLLAARRNSVTETSRPARFKPTEAELVLLVSIFNKNPFPSAALRQKLADKMGLDIKQVQFW